MASAATEGKKKRKQPRHQQSAPSKETGDDVLAAVQLIDSEAVEILSTSLNVALYEFRDASWVSQGETYYVSIDSNFVFAVGVLL